jgi:hypothetical protein
MTQVRLTPEQLVGEAVVKAFGGKLYCGWVASYLQCKERPADDLWRVEYSDGDSEEYDEEEVVRHYQYGGKYGNSDVSLLVVRAEGRGAGTKKRQAVGTAQGAGGGKKRARSVIGGGGSKRGVGMSRGGDKGCGNGKGRGKDSGKGRCNEKGKGTGEGREEERMDQGVVQEEEQGQQGQQGGKRRRKRTNGQRCHEPLRLVLASTTTAAEARQAILLALKSMPEGREGWGVLQDATAFVEGGGLSASQMNVGVKGGSSSGNRVGMLHALMFHAYRRVEDGAATMQKWQDLALALLVQGADATQVWY